MMFTRLCGLQMHDHRSNSDVKRDSDLITCKTESVKFRTNIPDCSMFVKEQATHFDGSCICGEEKELVQKKWPEPKRKFAG